MPGYKRYFQTCDVVFITMVTANRAPWLADSRAKGLVLEALRETKRTRPFRHFAHVLLPDHMHWLIQCDNGADISHLVRDIKLGVIHRYRSLGLPSRRLWQPRYYDHIIRDERDFKSHMDYIHYNPVKHGHATRPRDYPWSSFHTWVERGHYDRDWGMNEPDGPDHAGEP